MAGTATEVAKATTEKVGKADKPKLSEATKAGIKEDLREAEAAKREFAGRDKPIERTPESMRPFKGPQSEPTAEEQPATVKVTPIDEQLGIARPPVGDITDKLGENPSEEEVED